VGVARGSHHFIWVPIHADLIEHPTAGPVLVDTGISPEQVAHVDYYRGSIMEHVMDVDEYDLPADQTMPAQLARGSTSVLVDHRFLLAGDAMYTIRHLAVDQVRAIQTGDEGQYVDSVRRIQWLRREFPELVILTAHDHTDYGARLVAGLADGELSEADLSWAKSYERASFDELANLNPARLPRYVPAGDGGRVGHAA
jgi:hypothetical protein